jgi:tetratricopeptide (TPR) repeat protein
MRRIITKVPIFLILLLSTFPPLAGQSGRIDPESVDPILNSIRRSSLDPARRDELEKAFVARDYKRAETLLIEEIDRNPGSAELLTLAAGIFFLDGEYLNSAIAYKKAEAIWPLDERSRFTLAMAYIKLNRSDWARLELEKLAAAVPQSPLYLYWLARLDYDAQRYNEAIAKLRKVIELDPKMVRAYDNLGLCYDFLGKFDEAIGYYRKAIELNRLQAQPSPWPHLNLAVVLIARGNPAEAEGLLREALRYDPKLPQAHYQLGVLLEKRGNYSDAIRSLKQAADLDPTYPEPHYTLSRIYQKLGDKDKARESVEQFQKLKATGRPRR